MTARGRPRRLVVVGASLAGLRAVEAARAAGHAGEIHLVGAEPHLPYDRPPLSKEFLTADEAAGHQPLVDGPGLDRLGVTAELGVPATALDSDDRAVVLADDRRLPYDALVIATGTRARLLPGAGPMTGVVHLRGLDDARELRRALDGAQRVVAVGGGVIGSEVAASVRSRGLDMTVVEAAERPLSRIAGPRSAEALAAVHERHGTRVRTGVTVVDVQGGEHVTGVTLSDGSHLPADVVVVGIGVYPAVEWLAGSGVQLNDGVMTDSTLAVPGLTGVWAAGDVARSPLDLAGGDLVRHENWTSAAEQGGAAGRHAVAPESAESVAGSVPYLWSDWYGTRLQAAGLPAGEEIFLPGPTEDTFAALHHEGDRLLGAFAAGLPKLMVRMRRAIREGVDLPTALRTATELVEAAGRRSAPHVGVTPA